MKYLMTEFLIVLRYNAAIDACCLREDLETFVSGDETEVETYMFIIHVCYSIHKESLLHECHLD